MPLNILQEDKLNLTCGCVIRLPNLQLLDTNIVSGFLFLFFFLSVKAAMKILEQRPLSTSLTSLGQVLKHKITGLTGRHFKGLKLSLLLHRVKY